MDDIMDFYGISHHNFIYAIQDSNTSIFDTIENMIDQIRNNINISQINNEDNDTIQFNIEIISNHEHNHHNHDDDTVNYFNNCYEINEKLCKPVKIKIGDEVLNEDCLICMEKYKLNQFKRTLPTCKHYFHKKCVDKWLKQNSSCPICRDKLIKPTIEDN